MLHHTWEQTSPLQYTAGDRNLTFLLTRKLAATARPCVKLSMVLASKLRYPLICKKRKRAPDKERDIQYEEVPDMALAWVIQNHDQMAKVRTILEYVRAQVQIKCSIQF